MISKNRIVGPAVLAAVAGLSASASAQLVYNPVALTGTDGVYGPGLGTGVTFNGGSFNATPVINNLGQVAFRANASSTGSPEGMWISGGGVNTNVALAGGPRPGGGTYPTASGTINQMAVNDSGEWFMRIGSATGVVSTTGGVPARLANTGDVAPGTGSATFATSAVANGNPYYNNAGQVAFVGNLTTGTGSPTVTITAPNANAQGLWIGTAASGVNLVLRQNDTNPLFDAGQTTNESRLGSFQTASMAFNNNGSYVLSANLQGANIITSTSTAGQNNGVILSNRSGSLAVVARAGAVAPDSTGAPSPYFFRGTTSSGLSSGVIGFNNNGHVAWVGGLRDSGTTSIATQALFTDNGGTLRLVGRGGTAMPTIYNRDGSVNTSLAGVNWAGFGSPVLSANDTLAFQASGNSVASVLLTMDTAGRMTSIVQSATVAIPNGAPLGRRRPLRQHQRQRRHQPLEPDGVHQLAQRRRNLRRARRQQPGLLGVRPRLGGAAAGSYAGPVHRCAGQHPHDRVHRRPRRHWRRGRSPHQPQRSGRRRHHPLLHRRHLRHLHRRDPRAGRWGCGRPCRARHTAPPPPLIRLSLSSVAPQRARPLLQ